MKTSNFHRLMKRYVTRSTSKQETRKIEAFLNAFGKRKIHWLSDETEELFYRNICDKKVLPEDITRQVKSLVKLHVGDVEWMKFKRHGHLLRQVLLLGFPISTAT